MPPPGPGLPTTHAPPVAQVKAIVVVVVVVDVVVVAATVVVDGATVVVADATVVVADATVVVADGAHGSSICGTKTKPPNSTNGATTTDIRLTDERTQRATITPATNKDKPTKTKPVVPPVAGNEQTPTANITDRPRICSRHNSGQSD